MSDFKSLFISFAVLGLFVLAFMSFVINFQQDNDVSDHIFKDELMNETFGKLNTQLTGSGNSMSNSLGAFENETQKSGVLGLVFNTIPSAGKSISGIIKGVYSVIIILPAQKLGINKIVFSVLNAILLTLIIIGLWRLYKSGI